MAGGRGKNFGAPMTLANMRQNGVRSVAATCEACGHGAIIRDNYLERTAAIRMSAWGRCGGRA